MSCGNYQVKEFSLFLFPYFSKMFLIASTNNLEIPGFIIGPPLAQLPKPKKSCSDFLYEAERSMYTLKAQTGQSRDSSWLPVEGGNAESAMTWALNGVECTLGT